jgi:hypothetical protein
MSKKYVPAFLKDQMQTQTTVETPAPTRSFGARVTTDNKFAALADDYKREKPIINTSLPAKMAPTLAPATLASLTSNGDVSNPVTSGSGSSSGPKKSFASKFAEQVKIANDPNYKPPPKPVNFASEDDFPSLGGPKKPATTSATTVTAVKPATDTKFADTKFADLAKGWAKQKEDEAEEAIRKAAREERRRRERASIVPMAGIIRRHRTYDDDEDEDEDHNPNYDESSLGDDSYGVDDDDGAPLSEEDDEGQGEFNNDIGWDGRKRGDLY